MRKGRCHSSESALARPVTTTKRTRMKPRDTKILLLSSTFCPIQTFRMTKMAFGTLLAILEFKEKKNHHKNLSHKVHINLEKAHLNQLTHLKMLLCLCSSKSYVTT